MIIISLLIYLVFAFIWYYPLYRKQPQDETRLQKKELWFALFIGFLPAFFVAVAFQSFAVTPVLKLFGLQDGSLPFHLVMDIIGYAIGEELVKYLFARLLLKKNGFRSVNNTALLFGAVGAGFGLVESAMLIIANPNIVTSIMRGVISLHVFLQLWMGLKVGTSLALRETNPEGAKKAMRSAFIIPLAVHILQDVSGTLGGEYMTGDDLTIQLIGFVILAVSLTVDIIFIVKTLKAVKNSAVPAEEELEEI